MVANHLFLVSKFYKPVPTSRFHNHAGRQCSRIKNALANLWNAANHTFTKGEAPERRTGRCGGAGPPRYHLSLLQPKGEAPERRTGGCGGAGPPRCYHPLLRPKGEAPERRTGGVRSGRSPPATINNYYNIIFTTIFYNLKNLDNLNIMMIIIIISILVPF